MNLSSELIDQFVRATKDNKPVKKDPTTYGEVVKHKGKLYLKLDGANEGRYTPISKDSSTADIKAGDRVEVTIKNHQAIVTGNTGSPAARVDDVGDVTELNNKITELGYVVAEKVDTVQFVAEVARIDKLEAADATITEKLTANEADISDLEADNVTIKSTLSANSANITKLQTDKLDAEIAEANYATIKELDATDANVYNLQSSYANITGELTAVKADIQYLETDKLSAVKAAITYANIDFSNIGQAAMEHFYANSGLIENVVVSNGTITGILAGVTIRGDLIEANTLVADKLVIHGEDGLYYKLNTNGETVSTEQTEYNSLNGQVILAKSITAEKVNVDDLVAFDATIGGFNITDNAIFSEVKDSNDNVTRGIYMDTDGQVNFGDADNFIKYYRDTDGTYKLAISADSIMYTLNGKQLSIADLGIIGEYVHIGTYEDEPCIELGESDSEFKLRITNTRMIFTEGSKILAYFNNQSLHITKAVIEEELQQGGFVWKVRSNGNMGLMWKGVSS